MWCFVKDAFRFWVFMEFLQSYLIFFEFFGLFGTLCLFADSLLHITCFWIFWNFFRSFRTLCLFADGPSHIKIASGCDVLWKMHLGFGVFFWNFFRTIRLFLNSLDFSGLCASLLTASCISHILRFLWFFFRSFRTLCLFADGPLHSKIASGCDVLWKMHLGFGYFFWISPELY